MDDIGPFLVVVDDQVKIGGGTIADMSETKAPQYTSQIIELLPYRFAYMFHQAGTPGRKRFTVMIEYI
jgi:hypothetical protein